jgi:hypothetical protein
VANRTDNFNRADSSAALGTPSDGGSAWVSQFSGGGVGWGISGNKGYDQYDAGGTGIATLDSSSADTTVQATLSAVGNEIGLVARFSDTSNYLFIRARSSDGYTLFKRVAGSATSLGNYAGTPANGDVLALVMSGSSLTVQVNGVSRITATDSFNNTATLHGLWAFNAYTTSARWDDFSITDPGGGGATVHPWWQYAGPMMGALGSGGLSGV